MPRPTHPQAPGAGQVAVLLPVRRLGHLQPLRGGLALGARGGRRSRQAADQRELYQAGHLIVMKCADWIPPHRLAKQYQRLGIPMARWPLTDLFHAAGDKLEPLWKRLLAIIAVSEVVQADETSMKMQRPNK